MAYEGRVESAAGRKILQRWADSFLIPGKAGLSNESVMELGALVCTPRNPACRGCPLNGVCKAFARGNPERYPLKKKKNRVPHKIVGAGVVVGRDGKILIAQRKETSMLGGLWEFPGGTLEKGETMPECIRRELMEELGIQTEIGPRLIVVHHAYSHFTIDLHAHWARIAKGRPRAIHCADFAWVLKKDLRKYPFSKADVSIIDVIERSGLAHCPVSAKLTP
jgi:A/G-specific adenine glycosylase